MRRALLTLPLLLLILTVPARPAGPAGLLRLAGDQQGPPRTHEAAEIVGLVNAAADLIERRGRQAFAEFRKPGSRWRNGDLYLFAMDLNGTVLFNAAHPNREGLNWLDERDADGKRFHRDFVDVVTTYGSGWVDYMFPKPGRTVPSVKWSYLCAVTIDGAAALVGAGVYVD